MSTTERLISFWKDKIDGPHYHPEDLVAVSQLQGTSLPLEAAVMNYAQKRFPTPFESSVMPIPYSGDLRNAKVFILMLNPGLSLSDYHLVSNPEFVKNSLTILNQTDFDQAFPLHLLNPKYYYWSGFGYWHGRLRSVIEVVQAELSLSTYKKAISYVSQNTAIVQLIPYHSHSFEAPQAKLVKQLPSVKTMQAYVAGLVERARKKEIVLVVGRGLKWWDGLKNISDGSHSNILINKNRSFLLRNKAYQADQAIVEFLKNAAVSQLVK